MNTFTTICLTEPKSIPTSLGEKGEPISIKTTPTITRVGMEDLEVTYYANPTIFTGINKLVQTIMSAEHEIKAKDPKVKKFFDDFIESLGQSGAEITWEELLTQTFRFQCIYGKSWIENIFNKKGNRIVDWDIIDPKKMDYAKNGSNKLVLDDFGRPIGYFQLIRLQDVSDAEKVQKKIIIPAEAIQKGVVAPAGYYGIWLEPKRISQIKLYTVGDGFYPIGLVEPIYKTSLRKLNIEEGLANAIYKYGFPTYWAKLGDLNHEPSAETVQNMLTKLKDINFQQTVVTPYYNEIKILESKRAEKLKQHLDYFIDQEVTGMGMPKPYVTGSGENTNKATLQAQEALLQLTLRSIITKTCTSIRINMFKPICLLEGFKEVPTLWWETTGTDEWDKKASRLLKYIKAGVLDPQDEKLKDFIKAMEHLKESSEVKDGKTK